MKIKMKNPKKTQKPHTSANPDVNALACLLPRTVGLAVVHCYNGVPATPTTPASVINPMLLT